MQVCFVICARSLAHVVRALGATADRHARWREGGPFLRTTAVHVRSLYNLKRVKTTHTICPRQLFAMHNVGGRKLRVTVP